MILSGPCRCACASTLFCLDKEAELDSQEEKDPSKLESRYKEALNELKVLQRSAIVNQLYGGRQLAVEDAPAKEPEATLERADN